LRDTGVTLLGYVPTNFANRDGLAPLSQVRSDIALYHEFFGVNGIFLDEAASGYSTSGVDEHAIENYYQGVYDDIRSLTEPNFTSVINPGTHTNEEYFLSPATDKSVIFENHQGWESYTPDPYVSQLPSKNFAILLNKVSSIEEMKHAIDLALERNIGYVYVTNDGRCDSTSPLSCTTNPWDSLPSYWEEELTHIELINQSTTVPEPSSLLLLATGLGLLAGRFFMISKTPTISSAHHTK